MKLASQPSPVIADAQPLNWVTRYMPVSLQPYGQLMRLDRPIGWWLLLLPCWWGLALAHIVMGDRTVNWWYALLFLIGAIVMRGAGCTVNDITDRDIDALVARTKMRPLASGRISVKAAMVFLLLQLGVGLLVLLQFNWATVYLAAASLLIVAIYPFMKRVTDYPQFVLGLAFNWGALVGWTSIQTSLSAAPLLLYAGGICWTLAYDTIYAHQDKEDDVLIGVKSTALKFGDATPKYLMIFFGLALVLIDASFWIVGTSLLPHVAVAGAALHAAWQVARFEADDSARCLQLFKSNRTFGLVILAGLLLDVFLT
jgi:4-hydroxybenzoate polyprenyltransferase